jgi:hypothetical protein
VKLRDAQGHANDSAGPGLDLLARAAGVGRAADAAAPRHEQTQNYIAGKFG